MEAADLVPVATTSRSGVVESIHHGAAVGLDRDGTLAWSVGNPQLAVYPRSSLKPLQAQALIGLGLELPLDELAIACASHASEPDHVGAVRRLLERFGLDESALQNTPDLPVSESARHEVLRAGGSASSLLQNCSGKHAAMLAASVVNGWAIDNYLDLDHPVQRAIGDFVDAATGGVVHTGIDGCGAPTAMVSLIGMATAFRNLAIERAATFEAMTAHPHLVAGPGRADTLLMNAVAGLMSKGGAEGFAVAALDDGRSVAVRIGDGADRAALPVLLAGLRLLGVDAGAEIAGDLRVVRGHGHPVGEIVATVD